MNEPAFFDKLLLPAGSRVMPLVTRMSTAGGRRVQIFSGEPGEIVEPAQSVYDELTVEFQSGALVRYMPHEVVPFDPDSCPFNLRDSIVLQTRIGSHAHGIAHEDSDDDFRGVFVAPSDTHWSLSHTPRRIEYLREGIDELYYEIGGFVRRLLTGEPMAVETLFSHRIEYANDVGKYLVARRQEFLTKPALLGFPMFVRNQMRDYYGRHRKNKHVKPKGLMHTLRLAIAGRRAVQTGEMTLEAREFADDLVAIREGKWHFEKVNQTVHATIRDMENAFDKSVLPDDPAVHVADDCLIYARGWQAQRWLAANERAMINAKAKGDAAANALGVPRRTAPPQVPLPASAQTRME